MEDKFSNRAVSRLLKAVATAYILKKENRFKIIAYEKAADTVDHLAVEARQYWKDGKLDQVPGFGKSISSNLDEYFRNGHAKHFDEVLAKIPKPVFVLMEIPSIGPMKAYKLVENLGLTDEKTAVADLKKAAEADRISKMETFGKKSQEDILESIAIYERRSIKEDRMVLPYAFAIAERIIGYLKKNPHVKRVDTLGSLRRMTETIGDIDLAVIAEDKYASEIIKYFTGYPEKIKTDNAGAKKASIIVPPSVRIDLRIQSKKSYGSMLQYFTGSKAHNVMLREFALKKNYSLNEYGIKNVKKNTLREMETEEDFYGYLGLKYIPPLIREGTDEIRKAEKNQLPDLVSLKDVRGDLHLHSSYDITSSHDLGVDDYDRIAEKAKELGYDYVGFADHNPKSTLTDSQIINIFEKRKKYIDRKMENSGIGYFIGVEADIFPNGHIAVPAGAEKYLDYIVVSVHSSFAMDAKQMTARVLEAIKNPKVRIVGHPTGRYFGKREGFQLEWEKVFEACRKNGIALEINSWPERLDLRDSLVREAVNNKVKLVIDTDAHGVAHMDNMMYGVSVAGRGWAEKKDIVNTFNLQDFRKWLAP